MNEFLYLSSSIWRVLRCLIHIVTHYIEQRLNLLGENLVEVRYEMRL